MAARARSTTRASASRTATAKSQPTGTGLDGDRDEFRHPHPLQRFDLAALIAADGSAACARATTGVLNAILDRGWVILKPQPFSDLLAAARETQAACAALFDKPDDDKARHSLAHGFGYQQDKASDREVFRVLTGAHRAEASKAGLIPASVSGPLERLATQLDDTCLAISAALAPMTDATALLRSARPGLEHAAATTTIDTDDTLRASVGMAGVHKGLPLLASVLPESKLAEVAKAAKDDRWLPAGVYAAQKRAPWVGARPYGMVDIVRYTNDAGSEARTGRSFNVDGHVDPGLFALSILDDAPGLELYDPQTAAWVSPRSFAHDEAPLFVLWCGSAMTAKSSSFDYGEGPKPGLHRVLRTPDHTPRFTMWYEVTTVEQVPTVVHERGMFAASAPEARDESVVTDASSVSLASGASTGTGAGTGAGAGSGGDRDGGSPLSRSTRSNSSTSFGSDGSADASAAAVSKLVAGAQVGAASVGISVKRQDGSLRWLPGVDVATATVSDVKRRIELDLGTPFSKSMVYVDIGMRVGRDDKPHDAGSKMVKLVPGKSLAHYGIRQGDVLCMAGPRHAS